MEGLIAQINRYCRLNEQEEELIRSEVRLLHFPKGSVVIGEGKVDDSIYFIRQGVWRACIGRDGEDYTLWFVVPGDTVFSSWGFSRGLPSRLTVSSSSESTALELKKRTVKQLAESSPAVLLWINDLFAEVLINTDNMLIDLSRPEAEKRYLAFVKKMPEIYQTVPLKEIARFLGVTPQSLSRIRAGLTKDKK